MKGEASTKLWEAAEAVTQENGGDTQELYNILEGYTLQYLEEHEDEGDHAHCASCDAVINLDQDIFTIEDDKTYCGNCREEKA